METNSIKLKKTLAVLSKEGKNPSKVFYFAKKAFNEVALFGKMFVIFPWICSVSFGWNDDRAAHFFQKFDKSVAVKTLIANDLSV